MSSYLRMRRYITSTYPLVKKTCENCGEEFSFVITTGRSPANKIYCSPRCREQAKYRREKERRQ